MPNFVYTNNVEVFQQGVVEYLEMHAKNELGINITLQKSIKLGNSQNISSPTNGQWHAKDHKQKSFSF